MPGASMTKYATMNPLGSTSPYDLFDNSQNFDTAINSITAAIWLDRLGRTRHTWYGLEQMAKAAIAAFGYITMDSFQDGATLTLPNQVLRDTSTGEYYRWDGSFLPSGKVVPSGSTPASSGGISIGAWLSVGDAVLRGELINPAIGDALIALKQPFAGAASRTQHDKNAEKISATDAGAVGDGIANDQAAFDALEALPSGTQVDLLGRTYLLNTLPTEQWYFNGYIKRASDGLIFDAAEEPRSKIGNHNVLIGDKAGASLPKWVLFLGPDKGYHNIAIGHGTMEKATLARNNTAVGPGALNSMVDGRYNDAFGLDALFSLNSDDAAAWAGTRNVSLGSYSMRMNIKGHSNTAVGRNAGSNIMGDMSVAIGSAAMLGYAPLGLDGVTIENQAPLTAGSQVHVGVSAGRWSNNEGNVSLGKEAGPQVKTSDLLAIGFQAAYNLDKDRHYDGRQKDFVSLSGTFVWTDNSITVTIAAHGVLENNLVLIVIGGREANYLQAVSATANTFVINTPYTGNESGTVTVTEIVRNNILVRTDGVMAIGRKAMYGANNNANSLAVGAFSQSGSTVGINNVSFGNLTLNANTTGEKSTSVGYSALRNNTTGSQNSAFGEFSSAENLTGSRRLSLGRNALRNKQDGTPDTSFSNVIGVGNDTRVSGDNQAQIGDSAITTYVFGTVQNRSDVRDKADIRDTELGIEFILGLRPVDGRWDMRDDYIKSYPDAPVEPVEPVEPIVPTPSPEQQIQNSSAESQTKLHGQDPDNITLYHLDGDPNNPYSLVIETGSSDEPEDQEKEYPEDYYPRLLAIYLQERTTYEINLAQYQADLITYKNDFAEWEAECIRIKEHNARVTTGEERDGSMKRERFHHWFIAQEVKELCEKLGVDFGGYQDHSIAGGSDVKTLGYDEFIPPTVRAIQQCWERMDKQDARMDAQDEKIAQLEAKMAAIKQLEEKLEIIS